MNQKVDAYIKRSDNWPKEMTALRAILLKAGLSEEIKWGKPCYSHDDHNIVIMQEMKAFLALMFFKGALLDDPQQILRSQGPNSRSAMRLEFTSVDEVDALTAVIADYIQDAVDVEAAGLEVASAPPIQFAEELVRRLNEEPELKAAFEALTPGRQREYNLQIAQAKQSKTREARIDKFVPKILAGKGFRDR